MHILVSRPIIASIIGTLNRAPMAERRYRAPAWDGTRYMASQFSAYYRQSALILETIGAMLKARPEQVLELSELTQHIKEQHPDIGMAPTDLAKLIMRVTQEAGVRLSGPGLDQAEGSGMSI
jgi:hypothetical protein